jgi:hypothetical protein
MQQHQLHAVPPRVPLVKTVEELEREIILSRNNPPANKPAEPPVSVMSVIEWENHFSMF